MGQNVKQIQRQSIDRQLGVVPGAQKYGFTAGVSVPSLPQNPDGSLPRQSPVDFAQDYASQLQQPVGSSYLPQRNPGMYPGSEMDGPSGRRQYPSFTGGQGMYPLEYPFGGQAANSMSAY